MRITKIVTFCCLAIAGIYSISAQATPEQELQARLSKINTMQANFTQQVYSEKNKLLQSYSGNMEFKKPNLFRWEVQTPDQSLLVTDGQKLWNYDVALEQVTVQKYAPNKEVTPLSFVLDSSNNLNKNFSVEQMANSCYKLTPKQENQNFVNVAVCFKDTQITSLNILDHLGQNSKFEFSQVKNNGDIAGQRFSFKPPAGVDVVGE